jgi:uncharacterized protein YaaQ
MADIQIMMLAIIQRIDADQAIDALTRAGLRVTVISSIGSFLREGNVTLLLGLAHADVEIAARILSVQCSQRTQFMNAAPFIPAAGLSQVITPVEVQVGGAIIFTFLVDQHIRIDAHHTEQIFEPQASERSSTAKLLFVIVAQDYISNILNDLTHAHYNATLVSTTGGFLRKGNATLMIGIKPDQIDPVLDLLKQGFTSGGRTLRIDQAINIFVLNAELFREPGLDSQGNQSGRSAG